MALPTRLANYLVALHGLISGEKVLKDTRFDVMGSRGAVCRWRTLIKSPSRRAISSRHALIKDLIAFPEGQDLMFHSRKVNLWWKALKWMRTLRSHLYPRYRLLMPQTSGKSRRWFK